MYDTWTDGRMILSGASQQDVVLDKINAIVGTPTPTATPCSPVPCTSTPTNTPTFTLTPTQTPCGNAANYQYFTSTLGLIPGDTDTGNHTDDGLTAITLPFALTLYGQTYTTAQVSSNGQIGLWHRRFRLFQHLPARHSRQLCHLPALGRPAYRPDRHRLHSLRWDRLWYLHGCQRIRGLQDICGRVASSLLFT